MDFSSTDISNWSKSGISVIHANDTRYPTLLAACSDHPQYLFCKGDTSLLNKKKMSLVGTRQPTVYGVVATKLLIQELVSQEWVSVSGMMIGIDSEVHRATLAAGGKTIGVLGFGFGVCYPRSQERLLQDVIDKGGCLISEYPPGTPPQRHQFVRRNRIIAGLSPATIVVEAALKSGTMITVGFALDYGRVVGAVPGPITSRYSQGTADLLSQGAVCVSSLEAIWSELGENPSQVIGVDQSYHFNDVPSEEQQIWSMLQTTTQTVDSLVSATGLTVSKIVSYLEKWQLEDRVLEKQGMYMVVR